MNNKETFTETRGTEPEKPPVTRIYNKEEKNYGFKICTAIFAIVLSVITCICFGGFFDTESMYFVHSPIVYVFTAVICSIVVSSAAICVFSKKRLAPPAGKASSWINYFTALELLYLLIICIIRKNYGVAAVTLLPVIYFTGVFAKSITAKTLLGFGASLWCAVIIVNTYFSYDVAVNSPFKLICQFGLALSMLLIVSEIRFDLNAGNSKIYMLLACLSFCINLSAVCAQISLHAKGTHEASIYFAPACAMAIYSSKIFLAHIPHHFKSTNNTSKGDNIGQLSPDSSISSEDLNTDTQQTEEQKGHNTDEIVD